MGGTVVQQSEEQNARITQHLIADEQSYGTQLEHPPLSAQSLPDEKYAAHDSQSENRQSDYGQIGQQQDSFIVSQNDDNASERPTHYEPGLFQNYAQLGDDDLEQQELDQISDAHQSRGGRLLAQLMQN